MTLPPALLVLYALIPLCPISVFPYPLPHGGDAFQFDSDWRGQGIHFYRCAAGLGVFEIDRIDPVEGLKITFHVGEEDRYVNEILPTRARRFENIPHIFKNTVTLLFDVIGDDVPACIHCHSGDLFLTALSRTYS